MDLLLASNLARFTKLLLVSILFTAHSYFVTLWLLSHVKLSDSNFSVLGFVSELRDDSGVSLGRLWGFMSRYLFFYFE